jgi:iron-sulfur cluster assembly protein
MSAPIATTSVDKPKRQSIPIISVTEAAAERINALIALREKPALGIKVGVASGGCSGLSYTFEYAEEASKFDEIIEEKGVKVLIDPKAVMYLIGTTLDYIDEDVKSGFIFTNPNAKGQCGCGESFHV